MGRNNLSKSRYCSALQCPKMLWLMDNKSEEFDKSVMNQTILDNGSDVGDLAMGLFGEYKEVPFDKTNLSSMIENTKKFIDDGVENICEASFSYDNCFCSVDILRNLKNNTFELYEVKSSTSPYENYTNDVAYQYYILTKLGYKVIKANLVYLNNEYYKKGELELDKLFNILDLTDKCECLFSEIEKNIKEIKEYLNQEEEPVKEIGEHCFTPYNCGFFNYCAKKLPKNDEPTFFNTKGFTKSKALKFYNNDIITFEDLLKSKEKLNDKQKMIVSSYVNNSDPYVNKDEIKKFLSTISYPIYFLDFETILQPIPVYDGTKPYQQIVTQYSLHIIEKEGGEVLHKEYLANPNDDLIRGAAENLVRDIPFSDKGTVLVYNISFEPSRIREIATILPEYEERLLNINKRMVDLMVPFSKRYYYDKNMKGSHSIKAVLPSLFPNDPELDYHNLEGVHQGQEAIAAFNELKNLKGEELEKKREQLLKYCSLDTYAMVKIWQKLCETVKD